MVRKIKSAGVICSAIIFLMIISVIYLPGTGKAKRVAVDEEGDTGKFTSIDLTPSGEPRIIYYDPADSSVNYAFKQGGS
ncbi:MAG: hypothetical protein ACOCTK_01965, partial [Candidatus Saliniplasma sp.]